MSRNASVGGVTGDHDEEDAYLLARGCDDHRGHGRDCDGCLRPVARTGMGWRLARRGMEGWRMGTRSRGRGRRRGRDRRRDHRIPAAGLLGSSYISGRSRDWLKFKNPAAPSVKREAEEEWGKQKWR